MNTNKDLIEKYTMVADNFCKQAYSRGGEASKLEHEIIKCCETIIDLDIHNVNAYYKLGNALIRLGNYEKAFEYIDKVIQLDSKLPDSFYAYVYNSRGVIKGQQRDYRGALRDFETAIDLSADDAVVIKNINRVQLVMEHRLPNYSFSIHK